MVSPRKHPKTAKKINKELNLLIAEMEKSYKSKIEKNKNIRR